MANSIFYKAYNYLIYTAILVLIVGIFNSGYAQTYCSPSYPSGCTVSNNRITNVVIGTINHSPPGCVIHDYTSISTSIAAGMPTPLTITSAGWTGVGVAVDLNNDGDFNDPGEIMSLPPWQPNQVETYNLSITIPLSTLTGSYRMRVFNRLANSGNGTPQDSPCGTYGYGSWYDYTLNVFHQCATILSSSANPTQLCTSGTSSLNVTYTSTLPATVKWYNALGVQVGTGNTFTTPTLTSTTTYYAAVDNGVCDTPRIPFNIKVIPPVVAPFSVTPIDTTICEGKIVKITATKGQQKDTAIANNGLLTINKMPINGSSVNSAAELIYTAEELGIAGQITNIGFFKKNTNTTFNPGTVTIYMKNTTSAVVTNSASISGYTQVFSGLWHNTGLAANNWNNIVLNTPFDYEGGINNLSILIVRTGQPSHIAQAPTYRGSYTGSFARSSSFNSGAWSSGVSTMLTDTIRPDIRVVYNAAQNINWSPVTNLYKDVALLQPMNTADTHTVVYARPLISTVYNAYTNWNGCMSTTGKSSTITVLDTVHTSLTATICAGQTFTLGNQSFSTAGLHTVSFQATNFCDSIVHLNLIVNPYITNTVNAVICPGQTYTFNNVTYSTSQTGLKDTFATLGCDSIVTLNITANPYKTNTVNVTICAGQTHTFNGITYSTSQTGLKDTFATSGCDSIVTLNLTVIPYITHTTNVTICAGIPYVFNGITYYTSQAGLKDTFTTAGCDSIVTLNLTVTPYKTNTVNTTICAGIPFVFNGITYYTSQTGLKDTFATSGCDSIVTLNLTVTPYKTNTVNTTICAGIPFIFNGITYYTSQTGLKDTFTTLGCDSIVTLNLTVTPYKTNTVNTTICAGQSYTFNGVTYHSNQIGLKDTFTTLGCDSIVTLNLNVTPYPTGIQNVFICQGQSYVFNGTTYSASINGPKDTLVALNGCDSIVTLNLTVLPGGIAIIKDTSACGSLFYENVNYTSSTTLKDTVRNIYGCDSLFYITNITIHPNIPVQRVIDTLGCYSVLFEGRTYYTSTTIDEMLTNRFGCDSMRRVINIIVDDFELSLSMSPEDPYKGEGVMFTTSANTANYTISSWTPTDWFAKQDHLDNYLTALIDGTVIVTGASENGCVDTCRISFVVKPLDHGVFVPSAFSPNGDGNNDVFKPSFYMKRAFNIESMRIFDRWGKPVYASSGNSAMWNGTYVNGTEAEIGNYHYLINIKFLDGETASFKGDLTLVR